MDFVIGDNLAVEVKTGKEIRPRDLKGLKALSEEIPLKHKIIVSLSEKTSRLISSGLIPRGLPRSYEALASLQG